MNEILTNRDYLNFENRMTNELTVMFRRAEDPVTKEMARLQTLRTREWCRDYWVAMNREVPVRIRFSKEGRMNEHIALVKKWLANKSSVSSEELRANADAARAAYAAASASAARASAARAATYTAAYAAADAAAYAAADAADADDSEAADYWVGKYEELTDDKSTKGNETEAWG